MRRMTFISRSSILYGLIVVILLMALPRSIRRLLQTGDPYLFTRQFFEDILARLSGPGRLRFLVQPTVAAVLGCRDGIKDARSERAPFLWRLTFHTEHRREVLRSAISAVRDLVAMAILLDILSQFLIFREIHPGAALLVGPVLIALPYAVSRALTNRFTKAKLTFQHPKKAASGFQKNEPPA